MKTINAELFAEINTLEDILRVDVNELEVVKVINKQHQQIEELAMLLRMVLSEKSCERKAKKYLAENGLNNCLRE